jgi:hypothetical protein
MHTAAEGDRTNQRRARSASAHADHHDARNEAKHTPRTAHHITLHHTLYADALRIPWAGWRQPILGRAPVGPLLLLVLSGPARVCIVC